MPASRAVLADILEFNLDHTVAYTNTKASGRLAKAPAAEQLAETEVETLPAKVEDVVVPEVKLEEKLELQPEPTVEQVTTETTQTEELAPVDDVVTDETPLDSTSKKSKKSKKEAPVS